MKFNESLASLALSFTLFLPMTAEDSPSQSSILSQATSSLSSSADHFSHHLGFSSPNMTGFLEEDHHYFGSPSVSCEAPLDITDYNFSDYDFPRAQGTFKPFTHVEYIKIIVTIVVILVALAGNLGIIIAVSFNRTLRTTINLYLVNLAVADILICTCCMSVYLINQLTEPLFILGPVVCKLNAFCQMTCLTSSVLTLSAISCDRFIAILYPLQARFRVTKHRTGILIIVIWITSLVFALPFLLTRKHYIFQWRDFVETNCGESWPIRVTMDPITGSCIMSHPTKKIYYTFVTIALFFIPIVVMATAYTCVVWKLWANVLPGEHNEQNISHQHNAKKKVIKMVCIMLVAFVVCWVPLQIVVLYSQFFHSSSEGALPQWFNQASYLATFIAYSNSALNPIIYGGFNQTFLEALCNIFQCACKRRSSYPQSRKSTRTIAGCVTNTASLVNGSMVVNGSNAKTVLNGNTTSTTTGSSHTRHSIPGSNHHQQRLHKIHFPPDQHEKRSPTSSISSEDQTREENLFLSNHQEKSHLMNQSRTIKVSINLMHQGQEQHRSHEKKNSSSKDEHELSDLTLLSSNLTNAKSSQIPSSPKQRLISTNSTTSSIYITTSSPDSPIQAEDL